MNSLVARQPILDLEKKTWGYELLFRAGVADTFASVGNTATSGDHATLSVLGNTIASGLSRISGGAKLLVNFTDELLLNGFADLVPKEMVIIEVLENVEPTAEIVEACRALKAKGYTLALDDFRYSPKMEDLLPLADIVKVDFLQSNAEERREIAKNLLPRKIRLLAEKVETRDDFNQARELGYDYFQGYFFSKPQVMANHNLPTSIRSKTRLVQTLSSTESEVGQVADTIKSDPALTLQLLRLLNSAYFSLPNKITDIRQAITLLGFSNLRKWATILMISGNMQGKPLELLRQALFRAHFCELIATKEAKALAKQDSFFFVGLFSLGDALFDCQIGDMVRQLAFSSEIAKALRSEADLACPLSCTLRITKAVELGAWELVDMLKVQHGISDASIVNAYNEAIAMTEKFTQFHNEASHDV